MILITTRDEAINYIKNPANVGQKVDIVFTKKDGSLRQMTVLIGGDPSVLVKNPLNPGMDFKKHNLVSVYDATAEGYRSFTRDTLLSITIDGVTFTFEKENDRPVEQHGGDQK